MKEILKVSRCWFTLIREAKGMVGRDVLLSGVYEDTVNAGLVPVLIGLNVVLCVQL